MSDDSAAKTKTLSDEDIATVRYRRGPAGGAHTDADSDAHAHTDSDAAPVAATDSDAAAPTDRDSGN